MKPKSPKSLELYDIMIKRGYPAEFCDQITKNLNTDWTAGRTGIQEILQAKQSALDNWLNASH